MKNKLYKIWAILGALIAILVLGFYFLPKPEIKPNLDSNPIGVVACKDDDTKGLDERIKNCPITGKDKSNFKADRIAKLNFSEVYTDTKTGITIEIKDGLVTKIEDGVELYARAFKNGVPLGLGASGTIEWEKFQFMNPPIMVDDPAGTIVRTWNDKLTGDIKTRPLREDPVGAIRQLLVHTIKVTASKKAPILGTFGNTTTTCQPQAGEGGANVTTDAYVGPNAVVDSWAQIIAETVSIITDGVNGTNAFTIFRGHGTTDKWKLNLRSIFTFDCSAIPDTDVISSAILTLTGTGKADANSATPNIDIYKFVTTGNYNLVTTSDYQEANGMGNTSQTGSPITYANYSTTGANDFTFNATGRGNVSKTGVSGFAARNANYDVAATAPPWVGDGSDSSFTGAYADTAGTASDPLLTVVHAVAAAGGNVVSPIINFE